MSWNHRVLKRIHKQDGQEDSITYWICEAYYDGTPPKVEKGGLFGGPGYTLGIEPMSEDLSGLRTVLEQMLRAVDDVVAGKKSIITHLSGEGTDDPEG